MMHDQPLDDQPNNRDLRHKYLTNHLPSLFGTGTPMVHAPPSTATADDEIKNVGDAQRVPFRNVIELRRPAPPERIVFGGDCLDELLYDLTRLPPELAGGLFGPLGCDNVVSRYEPFPATGTSTTFHIDGGRLTAAIQENKRRGLGLLGIVHSHPTYVTRLSWQDVSYAIRLLNNPNNSDSHFFMPIVCNGEFYPYIVDQTGNISEPKVLSLRYGESRDE